QSQCHGAAITGERRFETMSEQLTAYLMARACQNDAHALGRRRSSQALYCLGGSRIDKGHGLKIDDQRFVRIRDPVEHRADGRSRTEEERAGYSVNDGVGVGCEMLVIGRAFAVT